MGPGRLKVPVHFNKLASWGGVSFLAGAAMATCTLALVPLPRLNDSYVITFLAYFLIAALAYVVAVMRLERDRMPLVGIWGFALFFRLVLLATTPTLSDDVYRYIWDGHLLNSGANPYAYPVNAPALSLYDTPLRQLVNHNWMASPYLPAAQVFFAFVERFVPQSPLAFQAAAVVLDMLTGWLVMDLLGLIGLPRRRVLIYLWNPLVVLEFAQGAHIDALMICLVMFSFWLLARARPGSARTGLYTSASILTLAGATLTKGLPLLLAPLFLRRWGWRRALLYVVILVAAVTIFASGAGWGLSGPLDGRGVFGALRIYANRWNYNSGLYHWLEVLLTGYQTPGAVPIEAVSETPIRIAKLITTGLLGLISLAAALLAWRGDAPDTAVHDSRTLRLLRLATIPAGAYLLLTTTIHPWYVTIILPLLPFLLPQPGETNRTGRFLWPWLYFSCAVAVSYLTYINLNDLQEYYLVRRVEYIPFFLLLLWAAWHFLRKPQPTKQPTRT